MFGVTGKMGSFRRTPPQPADPNYSSVALLMSMDGANGDATFTDAKGKAITNSNVLKSTARSQYGEASALFDSVSDVLTTPASSDFAMGTADFTVEAMVYQTARAGASAMIFGGLTDGTTNNWFFSIDATGALNLTIFAGNVMSAALVPLNAWTSVSVSRVSGVIYFGINGVVATPGSLATTMPSSLTFSIGRSQNASSSTNLVGNIKNLRVTKSIGRYNANYTPKVGPWPEY